RGTVRLDQFFFETASGRTTLPALPNGVVTVSGRALNQTMTADGHNIRLSISPQGGNFNISLSATPAADITKWGMAIEAGPDEYFTGLMERVVDGPQQAS